MRLLNLVAVMRALYISRKSAGMLAHQVCLVQLPPLRGRQFNLHALNPKQCIYQRLKTCAEASRELWPVSSTGVCHKFTADRPKRSKKYWSLDGRSPPAEIYIHCEKGRSNLIGRVGDAFWTLLEDHACKGGLIVCVAFQECPGLDCPVLIYKPGFVPAAWKPMTPYKIGHVPCASFPALFKPFDAQEIHSPARHKKFSCIALWLEECIVSSPERSGQTQR